MAGHMSLDPSHVELWLFGQLGLGVIYLVKELWKIHRDQSHKNTEDIGKLKLRDVKREQDLNAAWERIRMLEGKRRSEQQSSDS